MHFRLQFGTIVFLDDFLPKRRGGAAGLGRELENCGCTRSSRYDDKSSPGRGLTLGDRHSCQTEGGPYVTVSGAAAGTSYFFFVSKDPSLQSILFGARTGATRPRQMFRDACPFIPAYYVLILGARSCKARNTRPNRPNRSIVAYMHDSLHRVLARTLRRMRPSAD